MAAKLLRGVAHFVLWPAALIVLLFHSSLAVAQRAIVVEVNGPATRPVADTLAPELRAAVNMHIKFVGQTSRRRSALSGPMAMSLPNARSSAINERVTHVDDMPPGETVIHTDQLIAYYRKDSPSTRPADKIAGLDVTSSNALAQTVCLKSLDGFAPETLSALAAAPGIAYVEPDYKYKLITAVASPHPAAVAAHPQWGLDEIGQTEIIGSLGSPQRHTIVAVLDTGCEVAHPALRANLWVNHGEIPNNHIDDDHDGVIDDVNGADFATLSNPSGDLTDVIGHGTHCCGIIAASNPTLGIYGVDPQALVMPIRMLGDPSNDPNVYGSHIAAAFDYAVAHGAKVINCSWGGGPYSQAIKDAIARARDAGVLVVVASGNGDDNGMVGHTIDESDGLPVYPPSFASDPAMTNMIVVAAIGRDEKLASFSNFGKGSVHLAAPGVDIYSTWTGGTYELSSGTSMAAPFVSGAAALLLDRAPSNVSMQDIRSALLGHAKKLASLSGKCASGGTLDVRFLVVQQLAAAGSLRPAVLAPAPASSPSAHAAAPTTRTGEQLTLTGNVVPDYAPGGETTGFVLQSTAATRSSNRKIELDLSADPKLKEVVLHAMQSRKPITITGDYAQLKTVERGLADRDVVKVRSAKE